MFKKIQTKYQKYQEDSSSSAYQSDNHHQDATFMKLTKISSEDQRFILNETFQLSTDEQNQQKTFADQLNSMAYSSCSEVKNLHLSDAQYNSHHPETTKKRRKTFNFIKNIGNQPTVDEKVKGLLKYNQKYSYQKFKILHNPKIQRNVLLQNGEETQTFIQPEIITILDYQNESIISKIKVRQYTQFASKIKNEPTLDIKIPNFALVKIQIQLQNLTFKSFIGLQNGKNMKILLQNYIGNPEKNKIERNEEFQVKYYLVFDINQPSKLKINEQNRNQKKDSPQKHYMKSLNINRQVGVQSLQKNVFKPLMLFKNDGPQKPIQKQKSSYQYIETYLPQIKQYVPYRQMQLSPLKKQQENIKLDPYMSQFSKDQYKSLPNSHRKTQNKSKLSKKTIGIPSSSQNQFTSNQNKKSDFQKSKKPKKPINSDQLENQKSFKNGKYYNQPSQKSFSSQENINQKTTISKMNSKNYQTPHFNQKKTKKQSQQKSNISRQEYSQTDGQNQFRNRSNTSENFPQKKKSPSKKQFRIKSKPKNSNKQIYHSYQRINPQNTVQTSQNEYSGRRSCNSSQISSKYSQKKSKPKKTKQKVQQINSNTFSPNQLKEMLLKSTTKRINIAANEANYRLNINNIALDLDKFDLGGKFIKMFIQSRFRKKVIFGTNIVEMTSQKIIWSLNNCRFQEIGDYDMFHMEVYEIVNAQSKEQQNQIGFCGELIISCSELIYLTKSQQYHLNDISGKLTLYNGCLVKDKRIVGNCMISFSLSINNQLRDSADGQSSTQTIPQLPDQQLQQLNQDYMKNKVGGYSKAKLNHQKKQHKFRNRLYSQENVSTSKEKTTLNSQIYQNEDQQKFFQHNPKLRKYSSHMQKSRQNDSPTIKAMKQKQEYMNSIDQEQDFYLQN